MVFHEVSVTTSLLRSPGLFSVFWPILVMLLFGWSQHVLKLLSLPVPSPIHWELFQVHQLQLVSPSTSCSILFSSQARSRFFFFFYFHSGWSSGWDSLIRFYLKISEKFVCLVLEDGFWAVHIPLVRKVKFKLLAQFQVDHLSHPVMSSLILFLR